MPQGSKLELVIEVLFSDSHNEGLRIKKTRYNRREGQRTDGNLLRCWKTSKEATEFPETTQSL